MEKHTVKDIMTIVTYAVVLIFALFNLEFIFGIIAKVFNLILPFLIGIAIAFVLNIFMLKVERLYDKLFKKRKKMQKAKKPICLVISLLVIIGIIVLIFSLIMPQFIESINMLVTNFPNYVDRVADFLRSIGLGEATIKQITDFFNNIQTNISEYLNITTDDALKLTLGVASSIINVIFNLVVSVIFAIYLLLQKETILRQINKLFIAYLPTKHVVLINRIGKLSNKVFANFVGGQFVEAIIFGVLCLIGMLILNIPYALVISILIAFTALIPMFGAFIGTGIGAFLILVVDPIKALVFVIFIIILQQIEGNLIYPKVVGNSVGLPGIWVIVAVTIGGSLFGLIGMIISVPLCSILYSLIAISVNEKLEKNKKGEIS